VLRLTAVFLLVMLAPPGPGGAWRDAPEYLDLVAPAGARRAAYRTYVSPRALDAVLRDLDPRWQPKPLAPTDALGQTARYDRVALARLYGASRPLVARGPRPSARDVREAWTLISPYPDPTLTRLQPGTLLIVLSLGPS
jgi:hypothetical protein